MAGQKQKSAFCPTCGRQRLFVAPTPSHLLHLVLTLITFGIWLIVWLLIGAKTGPYRCSVCGTTEAQERSQTTTIDRARPRAGGQSTAIRNRECPFCKRPMRRDASVCPTCRRESAAWVFHEGYWWRTDDEGKQVWLDEQTGSWSELTN
jgi:RNA polymerase subunit RPABC4/transcription elongation factor Spt4